MLKLKAAPLNLETVIQNLEDKMEELYPGYLHKKNVIKTLTQKFEEIKQIPEKKEKKGLFFHATTKTPKALTEKVLQALIDECHRQTPFNFSNTFSHVKNQAKSESGTLGFNINDFNQVTSGPFYKGTKQLLDQLEKEDLPKKSSPTPKKP